MNVRLARLHCFVLAVGGFAHAQESPDDRPNFVVVLVDDMRWDDFGAAGHPFVETPNIDRIAREGAQFENAFTTTPLCSPARASFLTGLYAHTHGITDNLARNEASHRLPTFPRALNANGYDTAFIGKWHMGNDDSPRPGFTRWVAMRGQGEAIDPLLNIDGTRTPTEGYVTDILTEYTVDFIEHERQRPFLAYVSHKALHPNIMQRDDGSGAALEGQPRGFVPAPRHRGRYADEEVPRRPNASTNISGKAALERHIDGLAPLEPGGGTTDTTIRQRLEMLLAVDDSVGVLYDTLKRLGELDNTVFVVTSDHGYFYGEHGLGGERRLAYEETARIPMVIRYPKLVKAGTKVDELILSVDLAATLLELAGTEPARPLHGRSFTQLLRGDTPSDWRTSFLIEYYSDTVFPRIVNMGYKAVRTERYKYIHYLELDGMDELYDLETDPYETHNVVGSPEHRQTLKSLQRELERLLDETK